MTFTIAAIVAIVAAVIWLLMEVTAPSKSYRMSGFWLQLLFVVLALFIVAGPTLTAITGL